MNIPATASELLRQLDATPSAAETGHAPAPAETDRAAASSWLDYSESTDDTPYRSPSLYTAQELAEAVDRTARHLEAQHAAALEQTRRYAELHPAGLPEPFRGQYIAVYRVSHPWWLFGAALGVVSAVLAWHRADSVALAGSLIVGAVLALAIHGLTWRERQR